MSRDAAALERRLIEKYLRNRKAMARLVSPEAEQRRLAAQSARNGRQFDAVQRRHRRPSAYVSRSGGPGAVTCQYCLDQGATEEESFLLHSDPESPLLPAPAPPGGEPPGSRPLGEIAR